MTLPKQIELELNRLGVIIPRPTFKPAPRSGPAWIPAAPNEEPPF